MKTLGELVDDIQSLSDELCIVARRPWGRQSTAAIVRLDEAGGVPPQFKAEGLDYFLEVDLIREEVLGEWVDRLNAAQRFSVVLHYAEYDAWPEWFHALAQGSPSREG